MAQPNNPKNNPGTPGGLHKPTPRGGNTPPQPRTLPTPTAAKTTTTTTTRTTVTPAKKVATGPVRPFLFDKSNYQIMLLGVGLILLGLFLMAGGKSPDPHVFKYDEIFSFRRVTLAPLVMMLGFGLEFYAILKRPRTGEAIVVEMQDETNPSVSK